MKMFQIKKKTQKKQTNKMIQKIYLTKIRSFVCYFHFYSLLQKKKKSFKYKTKEKKCILIFVDGCCWSVMAFPKW